MPKPVQTGLSRVFLQDGGPSPANAPEYMGWWKAGAVSFDQGDVTNIQVPSENALDKFDTVDTVQGEEGNPEIPITARYPMGLSTLLRLARQRCEVGAQVHIGVCADPKDFNGGWVAGKVLILEGARVTTYSTDELGALASDERAVVNEEATLVGKDLYEVVPVTMSELAGTEIIQEVVAVTVCDSATCGSCGIQSDGCQVFFAVTKSAGGSPGLPAEVIGTPDGGSTFVQRSITTLGVTNNPSDAACVGNNLVVISSADEALHYAPIADILEETETWVEVTTGFVATKGPEAMFSLGSTRTWIVGEGGYVYFSDDPTSGVEVQNSGSATVQDLKDIDGIDSDNLVAVGASNAVIYTTNGGESWASVTGPAVGVVLNAVVMKSPTEWLVGTAGGALWYTRDSGTNWVQKGFPGSGSGQVRDIKFSTPSVGWMAHSTTAPAGRILRTIDGGYSWYVAPEGSGTIPANDYVGKLATCENANIVFGGGLAGNAVDGFLVKVA